MNSRYRPLLLAFAIAYAGLAVGSLLLAMNLAQDVAPRCVAGHCPGDRECCLRR